MNKETPSLPVQVLKPAKPAIVPKLKCGNDQRIADVLIKNHDEAVNFTAKIFDAGLFCHFIKSQLKHGEWGAWMQAHLPPRMWRLNGKGKPIASSTLSWHLDFTEGFAKKCKTTVTTLLDQIPKSWEFAENALFLQLADNSPLLAKAPEKVAEFRAKGLEIVKGKSAYQLHLDWKQSEEDDDGNVKVKRGRLKGQGGASKEQRAAAALKEEQARIEEIELTSEETAKWLLENADDKNFGQISAGHQRKLITALETGLAYLKRLADARKGAK